MSDAYIPNEDAQFRTWAEAFAQGLVNFPARYYVSPAQAASVNGTVVDFVAALSVSENEATRTKLTIMAKSDKRDICETLCRQYASLIKENAGISDEDKVAIGVRPVNPNRERIECPQTAPLLNILGNTPGAPTVVFADSTTPDSKKKPFGASELQLFVAVTDVADAPLTAAKFYAKVTRNPIAVEFTAGDDGKVATYYARWASVRGEVGPWSLPVSMRIAA